MRGILTTGTPLIGANGALTVFKPTGGQITVQGAGLNAADVDHDTLTTTVIAGNGPAQVCRMPALNRAHGRMPPIVVRR
jgi:filamentous hemagglutinin